MILDSCAGPVCPGHGDRHWAAVMTAQTRRGSSIAACNKELHPMAESGPCRRRGIGALGQWVQEMRWLAERRWGLYISESACETRPSKNTNGMHRQYDSFVIVLQCARIQLRALQYRIQVFEYQLADNSHRATVRGRLSKGGHGIPALCQR